MKLSPPAMTTFIGAGGFAELLQLNKDTNLANFL